HTELRQPACREQSISTHSNNNNSAISPAQSSKARTTVLRTCRSEGTYYVRADQSAESQASIIRRRHVEHVPQAQHRAISSAQQTKLHHGALGIFKSTVPPYH
ncbi:unnamed protein product, partial [Laminaria digitata]